MGSKFICVLLLSVLPNSQTVLGFEEKEERRAQAQILLYGECARRSDSDRPCPEAQGGLLISC